MIKRDAEAREAIISAAMELIEQYGDAGSITVRDIAARAGVGIGLINYHFQTKENLINICVQRMITQVIGKFEPMYKELDMKPLDKLKYLAKATSSFLAANPGISRISILSDLQAGTAGDNSVQTLKAYLPVVKEVCGDKKSESEAVILLHMLIASIQAAFLRKEPMKEVLHIDFFNKEERDAFVDALVDSLFA